MSFPHKKKGVLIQAEPLACLGDTLSKCHKTTQIVIPQTPRGYG